jgi:hypothetical protein
MRGEKYGCTFFFSATDFYVTKNRYGRLLSFNRPLKSSEHTNFITLQRRAEIKYNWKSKRFKEMLT